MTEQLHEPNEAENTPKAEKYESETHAESYLFNLMLHGKELSNKTFPTPQDAQAAVDQFHERSRVDVANVPDIGSIPFIARGEGVHVPIVSVQAPGNGDLTVTVDHSNYQQPLPVVDSRVFGYIGNTIEIKQQTSGEWKAWPYIVGQNVNRTAIESNLTDDGLSLARIIIEPRVMIACDKDSANIQALRLEKYRHHQEAVRKLELATDTAGDLIDEIRQLENELSNELPRDLIELHQVELLHRIGSKGRQCVENNDVEPDIINEAVAATLGINRALEVSGKIFGFDPSLGVSEVASGRFGGEVVGVVSEIPETGVHFGPTLAMSVPGEQKLYYAPLTEVTSFKF